MKRKEEGAAMAARKTIYLSIEIPLSIIVWSWSRLSNPNRFSPSAYCGSCTYFVSQTSREHCRNDPAIPQRDPSNPTPISNPLGVCFSNTHIALGVILHETFSGFISHPSLSRSLWLNPNNDAAKRKPGKEIVSRSFPPFICIYIANKLELQASTPVLWSHSKVVVKMHANPRCQLHIYLRLMRMETPLYFIPSHDDEKYEGHLHNDTRDLLLSKVHFVINMAGHNIRYSWWQMPKPCSPSKKRKWSRSCFFFSSSEKKVFHRCPT